MSKVYPFSAFLILFIFLCQCKKSPDTEICGLIETKENDPQHLKVLFIGNSHTYTYSIPESIHSMAESGGDSLEFEQSAPGGFDLEQHFYFLPTLQAINSRNWDYVVLQESGWRTALPDDMAETMVYAFADSLAEIIYANSSSTEILLFMTQGYREGVLSFGDEQWCENDPAVCTYEGMQHRIHRTYLRLSENLDADLAPAGAIWKIFMDEYEDIPVYQADGIHANPEGSYLSACVIYSMLYRKKPEGGFIPAAVNSEDAAKIQATVSDALFHCNPDWRL